MSRVAKSRGPIPVDQLSAYLDDELEPEEARAVAARLTECEESQRRLEALRRVVHDLNRLEQMAPPPTLGNWVARRVALEGKRRGLMEQIEERLGPYTRPSLSLFYFALVLALATILWMFAHAVEREQKSGISVVFEDPPWAAQAEAGERRQVAGRTLVRHEARWVEEGVSPENAQVLAWGSQPAILLLEQHPELAELSRLELPVVLSLDGTILSLHHPGHDAVDSVSE